jgi:hypothetical protein
MIFADRGLGLFLDHLARALDYERPHGVKVALDRPQLGDETRDVEQLRRHVGVPCVRWAVAITDRDGPALMRALLALTAKHDAARRTEASFRRRGGAHPDQGETVARYSLLDRLYIRGSIQKPGAAIPWGTWIAAAE